MDPQITFGYVESAMDYSAVLTLRKIAYSKAGKKHSGNRELDFADQFDKRSAIIVARYKRQIIGSVRVTVHTPGDLLYYGRFYEPKSSWHPNKDAYVEGSRLCIDPNFQGRGLFYQLAKKMLEAGDRSGRAYIVGGCDESLVTIWQRVGFTTLPIWFNDGDLGSIEQQLIIKELHPAVVGCIDNSAARHRRP